MFRVHPTAIYPPDGSLTTDKGVVMRTGATHLISLMNFEHGMTLDKIDQNAVLLKGDKTGNAIRMLREENAGGRKPDYQEVTKDLGTKVPKLEPDTLPNSQQSGNGHIRSVFPESLEEVVRITKAVGRKPSRKQRSSK